MCSESEIRARLAELGYTLSESCGSYRIVFGVYSPTLDSAGASVTVLGDPGGVPLAEVEQWLVEYEEYEANPLPLVEEIAENLAIYAGVIDDTPFLDMAARLLRSFEVTAGRPAENHLEVEDWFRQRLLRPVIAGSA
jgi:hypothetical protein